MRFRCGRWRRPVQLLCAVALAGPIFTARAAPLDDPHIGGLSFNGPTSADLSSVYWNPAALGLVRGFQLTIAGTTRVSSTTVNRGAIDPVTGQAGGSFQPGSATANNVSQPLQWPPGPGAFIGVSTDLGGDRVTLAFATYMPFVEQAHFPVSPSGNEPTRYYRLDADLRNLALVPALAIRFGSDFRIGMAPGFLFSTGRLSFAEDTGGTGQAEDPAAAARYNVDSGQSILNSRFSVTLGGGLYYRRKALEFGLSYSSRPLGSNVDGVEVAGANTVVTRPVRDGGGVLTCSNGQSSGCIFGDVVYRLPDIWIAGLTWHPRPGLEVTGIVRWIWMHLQDRIDVRLTSPALAPAGIPDHIVFYRGLKDVWDTRVRVAYWIRERVRLGAALRVETSAVNAGDVNPAAVDGLKFEPMVMCEVRATRRLSLTAGYGFTYMPSVTAHPSSFDPQAATECQAAGQSIDNPSCIARNQGRSHPTADGTYAHSEHDFSLAMTARF
jgi:long-subunit fatty acid transport protein